MSEDCPLSNTSSWFSLAGQSWKVCEPGGPGTCCLADISQGCSPSVSSCISSRVGVLAGEPDRWFVKLLPMCSSGLWCQAAWSSAGLKEGWLHSQQKWEVRLLAATMLNCPDTHRKWPQQLCLCRTSEHVKRERAYRVDPWTRWD